MRGVVFALVVLHVLLPIATSAAEEKVSIQLNSVENTDNRCRLNFVIENKSQVRIESMKLDLVAFGGDGGILNRVIVDMGPVRPAKTMVRAFAVDAECAHISELLIRHFSDERALNSLRFLDGTSAGFLRTPHRLTRLASRTNRCVHMLKQSIGSLRLLKFRRGG